MSFRKWLREFGGGEVPYEGRPASAAARLTKEQLLNRAALHTSSCTACQQVRPEAEAGVLGSAGRQCQMAGWGSQGCRLPTRASWMSPA